MTHFSKKAIKRCIDIMLIKNRDFNQISWIILDENIVWNKQGTLIGNKMPKNIIALFQTSQYIDSQNLENLFFSFIHSYVKFCNME